MVNLQMVDFWPDKIFNRKFKKQWVHRDLPFGSPDLEMKMWPHWSAGIAWPDNHFTLLYIELIYFRGQIYLEGFLPVLHRFNKSINFFCEIPLMTINGGISIGTVYLWPFQTHRAILPPSTQNHLEQLSRPFPTHPGFWCRCPNGSDCFSILQMYLIGPG